jgi:hypothetical protein
MTGLIAISRPTRGSRGTRLDVLTPFSKPLEDAITPTADKVAAAVRRALRRS